MSRANLQKKNNRFYLDVKPRKDNNMRKISSGIVKKFSWFNSEWTPIIDELYNAFTKAFIEEIQHQLPLNDFDNLPYSVVHGFRPLSFWVDHIRNHRQWAYWASVEFDFIQQVVRFKVQGRSTWMDWKKFDFEKASVNIFKKATDEIFTEKNINKYQIFLKEYINKISNTWVVYDNAKGNTPSFKVDERYID